MPTVCFYTTIDMLLYVGYNIIKIFRGEYIMKWIMGIGLPSLLILIGVLVLIIKPKINSLFGFRTSLSMSSEENWNFCNKLMAYLLIAINAVFCIPVVCIINTFVENTLFILLGDIGIVIFGLILTIIITHYSLLNHIKKQENKE